MCDKRHRSENYSLNDILMLVDVIQEFKSFVENKKTDSISCNEKNLAWERICKIYNSQVISYRNPGQLRQKYDNLKKETRKYYAQQRQRLQTDGGPNVEHKLVAVYAKIHSLIKLTKEEHQSCLVDSAFFESPTTCDDIDVKEVDLTDNSENKNSVLEMCKISAPLHDETHSADMNWNRNPIKIAQSATLDESCSYLQTCDTNHRSFQLLPNKTNDMNWNRNPIKIAQSATLDESCSYLQTCDTNHRSFQLLPNKTNERVDPGGAITAGEEDPSSTQVSGVESGKCTCKSVAEWQRARLAKDTAKRELVELQMALLQKQHDETHRREEELFRLKKEQHNETHRREEELFRLKKESLELKIRIRKEQLKQLTTE